MSQEKSFEKGRGAQINPTNRFSKQEDGEWFDDIQDEEERFEKRKTKFIDVYPKTIVNHVKSPDVPDYSMNPYQGCEHGCIYCFARNSHEYWGYSAGKDFEQVILVKRNASELLEQKLSSKSWKAHPIVLSGNTDCYQPIERKLKITRETLKVFLKYKHPVGLITKESYSIPIFFPSRFRSIKTISRSKLSSCSDKFNLFKRRNTKTIRASDSVCQSKTKNN